MKKFEDGKFPEKKFMAKKSARKIWPERKCTKPQQSPESESAEVKTPRNGSTEKVSMEMNNPNEESSYTKEKENDNANEESSYTKEKENDNPKGESSNTLTDSESITKMKILSTDVYHSICKFIRKYNGLAMDCELELLELYPNVERLTIKSIVQTEFGKITRSNHWQYMHKAEMFMLQYDMRARESPDTSILVEMSEQHNLSPTGIARCVLQKKYGRLTKQRLSKLFRYPCLIEDPLLAKNIVQCLCADSQDGPLVDLRRRILGEEYELKLRELAKAAKMDFYVETDLRRMGYDKTPDIKMILPFLYKGQTVVNWIESKAVFGDVRTHGIYTEQQYTSYCNRFGSGIVIYWLGYHETVATLCVELDLGVTVLADFPSADDIEFLDLSKKKI